jgi:hypothetical protein
MNPNVFKILVLIDIFIYCIPYIIMTILFIYMYIIIIIGYHTLILKMCYHFIFKSKAFLFSHMEFTLLDYIYYEMLTCIYVYIYPIQGAPGTLGED